MHPSLSEFDLECFILTVQSTNIQKEGCLFCCVMKGAFFFDEDEWNLLVTINRQVRSQLVQFIKWLESSKYFGHWKTGSDMLQVTSFRVLFSQFLGL